MLEPNKLIGWFSLILMVLAEMLALFPLIFSLTKQVSAQGEFFIEQKEVIHEFLISQESILLSLNSFPNYFEEKPSKDYQKISQKINVIVTGYSSTPEETDDTPFITAAGSYVRKGIVANNFYPFGTKVRFPTLFGNQIFIIEDRMHPRKGDYNVDIWFPSQKEALNFGVKITEMEILKN